MSDDSSTRDTESSWPNPREKIIYQESKHVLEAQKNDIDDIDDKALRTVRITAILFAVGVTGIEIIGVENINTTAAGFSIASLFLSLIFGVLVYNESDELIGPKASYLKDMREESMEAEWNEDLLYQLEHWVEENQKSVEFNGYLLIFCQLFFILGIGTGVLSLLDIGVEYSIIGVIMIAGIVGLILVSIKARLD